MLCMWYRSFLLLFLNYHFKLNKVRITLYNTLYYSPILFIYIILELLLFILLLYYYFFKLLLY